MNDAELFECCASHIEESFENWDLKMPLIEIKKENKLEPKFMMTTINNMMRHLISMKLLLNLVIIGLMIMILGLKI